MQIILTLEPTLEKLEDSRREIKESLAKLVGDQPWSYEFMLAIEEAIVNVIDHGFNQDNPPSPIILIFERFEDKLLVTMIDKGSPFDLTKTKEMNLAEHFDSYKNRGLGIFLIKNITDHIDYSFSVEEGNKLIMEKRL